MNPGSSSNAARNEKVFRSISYVLVFLMMVSVVMTVGSLVQNLVSDWHSGILAGILLFIVIDRLYTYKYFKSLTLFSSEWAIALGTQWVVIVLFIRLLLSYANGLDAFLADLSHFARGEVETILSPEFIITLLLTLLFWYLPTQFLGLLDEIGLDAKDALREPVMPVQSEIVPAHQRLVNLIFGLGIVLVILTAITAINLRATFANVVGLPHLVLNRLSGGEAGALLYFAFGLALLSLSRLMSLHTHWNRLRIPVSSGNLTRQWGVYSLVFLLVLAVLVSLLPAGDSLGFFSLLGSLFGFLFMVIFFVVEVLIVLVALLISLPLRLFGKESPLQNLPTPSLLPNLPTTSVTPAAPSATWMMIRSIILWGALALIIIFSFIRFVSQHESILAMLRKSRITNWLLLAWQWLYRNVGKTGESLSHALAAGWQNIVTRLEGKRLVPRPGWLSLRALDPRRKIFFFYFAMIRRGDEQGFTRKPSQTPAEYAATLENAVPAAGEDIDSLTDAFVEARYSRHEVDSREADLVKATWARIRRVLRGKSDKGEVENK